MFCISFVITWISKGCLVWVFISGFCWVFLVCFFSQGRLSYVYKLFSRHTFVKDRTYTYFGLKKFLKTRSNYLMHSFLESFPIIKQYLVILQSLIIHQKNTSFFIKCLSFQKYREIYKQNIFKYAFTINMRLLLLQFITCNMKPIVFAVVVCAQTNIFQQTVRHDRWGNELRQK